MKNNPPRTLTAEHEAAYWKARALAAEECFKPSGGKHELSKDPRHFKEWEDLKKMEKENTPAQ